jgi:hypothetical protein
MNAVFWEVTPCGSCKNRRFGGTFASITKVTRIGDSSPPDDEGARFLRNFSSYKSHTAQHPKRRHSSVTAVKTPNLTIV